MKVSAYAALAPNAPLQPFTYELPEPGPLDVDVRVQYCGICHSDLAMISNDWGFSQFPLIAGHEAVGIVERVGPGVTTAKPGDLVGVGWQSGSCLACNWCRTGKEHLCLTEQDTIVGRHGAFASHVRVQDRWTHPIPPSLDPSKVGPLMCAGSTVYGPIVHHKVTAGMRTAVVGIGGLGHLGVQFLAKMGCEVTAVSSTHDKDAEAKKLGATRFLATRSPGELAAAKNSFDFILCTASSSIDWGAFLAALRPEGTLVICGIPDKDVSFPAFTAIQGERKIAGGRTPAPGEFSQMLDFCARTGIYPMTELFPASEINAAIAHTHSGKARWRTVLKF